MSKKLALSLSGGGAKAMIYLGVIKALNEAGIHIDMIGGLSGGSIVAAMIGCGMTVDRIYSVITHAHLSEFLDLNPFDGVQILDQAKVYEFLKDIIGGKQIEDCNPPVLIFATDVDKREHVLLSKGDLSKAVMASCALYPLMQPIEIGGHKLIEGGLTTLFGANYFRDVGADVVIGADVNGFANMKLGDALELVFRMFSTAVAQMGEYEQKLYPVDVLINDFQDETGMFEFNKMSQHLMDVGYLKTQEVMPRIRELLA